MLTGMLSGDVASPSIILPGRGVLVKILITLQNGDNASPAIGSPIMVETLKYI